jgi:hypothetical protein
MCALSHDISGAPLYGTNVSLFCLSLSSTSMHLLIEYMLLNIESSLCLLYTTSASKNSSDCFAGKCHLRGSDPIHCFED